MYNPQMYVDRLNNQIRELEAMKGQIPQPITQNFQLAPQNSLRYADSIEEVEKYMSISHTLFDMFMIEHNNIGKIFKEI